MKSHLFPFFAAVLALTLGAGCAHVDLTPEGSRNRVLTGTLNAGVALPAGAEVLVRIVAAGGLAHGPAAASDIPVARPAGQAPAADRILGEFVQKLAAPAGEPVAFRIDYDADDALLRHGVNLEARIFFDGRVRFRTVNAYVVTLTAAPFPQHVELQPVAK
jgi:uncharacterized lipoprotein YbaY